MPETTKTLNLKFLSAAAWASGLRARMRGWPFFQTGRRKRLGSAFAEVEAITANLAEATAALEERFLETATLLTQLNSHGELFVRRSENLVDVATGKAGGSEVFFQAMQAVDPPLVFLNASHEQMKILLARLEHDGGRIAELIAGREDLQRAMAPLKHIQTSFRIEAAPLGAEVQAMFTALTQDIGKLHLQVCELFTTKYEELQHIQRTIREVIQKLQTQTASVWTDIAREKKQIDGTLAQLQRDLADNQRRESSIASLSGGLSREIQKVVIGLQFQDIINQRLQHTAAALAAVRGNFDGSIASVELLEQACRLQAGQIAAVRGDLAGAEKSVKDGIQNVLVQIVEADKKCVSMREFENLTTSANGMVQVLLDVFSTLQKQIDTTVSGCGSACEILRPIGSMASDLTQVVHELSQRIHLIGLNAQVQAAQVPEGMGLEVLSARTSEISRDTNRISEGMASQLDRLVSGLTESLQALEKLSLAGGGQKNALLEKSTGCEQRLHALRDGALAALVDVFDLLNGIRAQGERVMTTADYLATADGTLAELQKKLEELSQLAAAELGSSYRAGQDRLKIFEGGYTMASERQVHDGLTDGDSPSPAGDACGVELFDAAPVASTAAKTADANVELF